VDVPVDPASSCVDLRLQVGRRLLGRRLTLAVLLRNLPLVLTGGMESEYVAPAWVVVSDRPSGDVVGVVRAGRAAGAGEEILQQMLVDAGHMALPELLTHWHARPAMRWLRR